MYLSGMIKLFKTYLFTAVLSFLVSFNVGASFSSIEKKGYGSVYDLNNAGGLKKFLDDDIVKGFRKQVLDEKLHEKFPNLSIDELTAIKTYTSDGVRNGQEIYKTLNTQLRTGNLDDYNKGLNQLLNDGLSKMKPYSGNTVFRGCGQAESKIAKTWKKGDEIKFRDFKSSSITENVAEKFMNKGDGDVIYEILNPKGYNICDISCFRTEGEIFFKSGSKFKIKKIEGLFIDIDKTGKKIILEYVE